MPKYQLVPVNSTEYWLATNPTWFPIFDTEEEAWDYYEEEADALADVAIREVKVIEVTA